MDKQDLHTIERTATMPQKKANSQAKRPKMTLEEDIMESSDHSTSTQTCINTTQLDLEHILGPILKALLRMKRNVVANKAGKRLQAFIEPNQVNAAINLYYRAVLTGPGKTQSDEVHKYLEKNLRPIVTVLLGTKSPRVRRLAERLRKVYEKRNYHPRLTREQMIQYGFIRWEKMTLKERVAKSNAISEQNRRICMAQSGF